MLRQTAMNQKRRLVEVAESVLAMAQSCPTMQRPEPPSTRIGAPHKTRRHTSTAVLNKRFPLQDMSSLLRY